MRIKVIHLPYENMMAELKRDLFTYCFISTDEKYTDEVLDYCFELQKDSPEDFLPYEMEEERLNIERANDYEMAFRNSYAEGYELEESQAFETKQKVLHN